MVEINSLRQIHEDVRDLLVSVCFLKLHCPHYCQIFPVINTILCWKYLEIEGNKVKQIIKQNQMFGAVNDLQSAYRVFSCSFTFWKKKEKMTSRCENKFPSSVKKPSQPAQLLDADFSCVKAVKIRHKCLFSTSASLLLPWNQVHLYHFSRFHVCELIYDIGFSLSDLLHSV